jgi:imidazolonepropionase-like amidohydrolase
LLLAPQAWAEGDTLVLRGGRVVTVSGEVIENGVLVVTGGRIAAVGRDVPVPPGATSVDVSGRFVYPGLFDGLTNLGLTEIGSVRGSVDTTELGEVNPNAQTWVALNPHSELIPVTRAGGVSTALSIPTGGLVSGQSAVIRLAGTTPGEMTVRPAAALHVVFPSGGPAPGEDAEEEREPKTLAERIKEKERVQRQSLERLASLLEEARAYSAAREAAEAGRAAAPKPDALLEALGPAARGQQPVVVRADAAEDIRAAVAFAEAQRLRLVLAGGLEAWRVADLLRQKDVPVLLKVLRLPRKRSDPYDAPFANAAILHRAGVRFAIVTDDESNSRNLPHEAAMAHAFGLPREAALRAITLSPAEILGVGARLGSLEAGKDATLVVASGDILDHRTRVEAVYIDGVAQPLETRHTRLWERFRERR